jgi:hypothetical protein
MSTTSIPKTVLLITGLVSAAVLVSALAGVVMAWVIPPKTGWAMVGFEVALILTGVVGLLFARGKFADAPALTLACLAGAVFVASFLGYFGVQKKLGTFPLGLWLAGRTLAALVLGAASVAVAMGSSREGRRLLFRGLACGIVPLAVGGWYYLRGLAPLSTPSSGTMEILRVCVLGAVVLAVFVCLCAAVHLVVRAFEVALPPEEAS